VPTTGSAPLRPSPAWDWAGAAAVGLLVLTAFAGSGLSGAKRDARRRIRRNHVATMFAVLAVGIVHTALNGPLAGR
jgi:hypothetical protein